MVFDGKNLERLGSQAQLSYSRTVIPTKAGNHESYERSTHGSPIEAFGDDAMLFFINIKGVTTWIGYNKTSSTS